jgi:hypothetical protein
MLQVRQALVIKWSCVMRCSVPKLTTDNLHAVCPLEVNHDFYGTPLASHRAAGWESCRFFIRNRQSCRREWLGSCETSTLCVQSFASACTTLSRSARAFRERSTEYSVMIMWRAGCRADATETRLVPPSHECILAPRLDLNLTPSINSPLW